MTKIKKLNLKPSARDSRRYFLVSAPNKEIEEAILEYIGVLGFAKSAYKEVKDKKFKDRTIGSCLTKSLNDVRAALSFKGIKIEKVSGTIAGLTR